MGMMFDNVWIYLKFIFRGCCKFYFTDTRFVSYADHIVPDYSSNIGSGTGSNLSHDQMNEWCQIQGLHICSWILR